MALATNYVDDVLDGSLNAERVYNLKDANGNIIQANVSIDDVSVYLQQGSVYSAELVNAQNTLLNQLEIDEIKDITITEWNSMSDAQKSAKNYCVVEDGKGKLYVKGKETSGDSITVLSRAEFNALPTAKQNKGAYYIYDADGSVFYNASQTAFDNTGTGMASGNVQQAIEELNSNITFTDLLDTASAEIMQIKHHNTATVQPTVEKAVYAEDGTRLDNKLKGITDSLNGKVDVIIRSGESVSFDTKTPAYGSGIVFAVIGGYGSVVFAYSLNGTTVSIVDLSPITATGKITPSSNGTTITFSTTGRNTNYKIIDF